MNTPSPGEPSISAPPPRRAEVKPLAPERYKIQFTVDRETHDKLRRAQDLLRHTIPDGDPAAIFDKAITLLLKELSKAKHAAAARPRSTHPPAAPGGPHGTFLLPCDGRCGNAMARSAHLSAAGAGARRRASSSSITSSRMPLEAKPRSRISNCDVARTTRTRRSSTTALAGRRFCPTNTKEGPARRLATRSGPSSG